MLYETHEVIGSSFPIFKNREKHHFTLEDILNSNQSLDDFERCGFVQLFKYSRTLYVPVYARRSE